jgi:hypothetical protein
MTDAKRNSYGARLLPATEALARALSTNIGKEILRDLCFDYERISNHWSDVDEYNELCESNRRASWRREELSVQFAEQNARIGRSISLLEKMICENCTTDDIKTTNGHFDWDMIHALIVEEIYERTLDYPFDSVMREPFYECDREVFEYSISAVKHDLLNHANSYFPSKARQNDFVRTHNLEWTEQ